MTPEQTQLMKKADRSVKAAQRLSDDGDHDFAVARAYYAMFYVATAMLLSEGLRFSSHAGVIGEFGRVFAKTGRIASDYHSHIREAAEQRDTGDYDSSVLPTQAQAEEQIQRAGRFIQLGENFFSTSSSPQEQ